MIDAISKVSSRFKLLAAGLGLSALALALLALFLAPPRPLPER